MLLFCISLEMQNSYIQNLFSEKSLFNKGYSRVNVQYLLFYEFFLKKLNSLFINCIFSTIT